MQPHHPAPHGAPEAPPAPRGLEAEKGQPRGSGPVPCSSDLPPSCLEGTVHVHGDCPPRHQPRAASPTLAGAVPAPGGAAGAGGVCAADTFRFLLFFSATLLSFLFCFAILQQTNCKDTGNKNSH